MQLCSKNGWLVQDVVNVATLQLLVFLSVQLLCTFASGVHSAFGLSTVLLTEDLILRRLSLEQKVAHIASRV